jgi:hypothetical protein
MEFMGSQNSSVGKETDYGLDYWECIPGRAREVSVFKSIRSVWGKGKGAIQHPMQWEGAPGA